ncbi:MAG: N-acetylmuramoyl-L-alanine amidase [Azonexus sp.]|uniref:N-acetylmuramoyl-L-alanine amidase n=1 Tax=Azonexus sp. TaxID=1872668 RepID=UPI00281D5B9F|nr:N-acetylmuramoyl-L-alanine amidase [Azonexus sp.]MDR0776267.1 N-acetylmuramoyl-L-alanine amidase [Azonexus sp.]
MNKRPPLFFLMPTLIAASVYAAEVAVDVGHGRLDGGAISARGRSEFDFNRQFAEVFAAALAQRELAVRRINFAGDIGSLAERPQQAIGADFFLSIHHDSIGESYLQRWEQDGEEMTYTDAKRGFGLFVSARNPDLATSLRCASAIGAVLRRNGFQPSPWHGRTHLVADGENGVWYYDNLVVLYRATLPAVLFEAGVIKHREEELELLDPQRQARMADAVATGIAACLSITEIPARD